MCGVWWVCFVVLAGFLCECVHFFILVHCFCGYNVMNMEYNTALSTKKSLFANNHLEVAFKTLQIFCLFTAGDPWQFFDRPLSIEGGGRDSYL